MPELPGHERRKERRGHRRERRRVLIGQILNTDDLEDVDLEEVPPSPEPEDPDEANEPWGRGDDKPTPRETLDRLRAYREHIRAWREEHHDEPEVDEHPDPVPDPGLAPGAYEGAAGHDEEVPDGDQ